MIACMVCTTPFQVLCCINIVTNRKIIADLYVINRFQDSEKLVERLKHEGVFRNVYHVIRENHYAEADTRIKRRLQLISHYMNIKKIGDSIIREKDYTHIYVSNNAVICRLIYLYLLKQNNSRKLVFFDDGVGTYYGYNTFEASKIEKLYRMVFADRSLYNIDPEFLLFHPNVFKRKHPYINVDNVYKMPPLRTDIEFQRLVKNIYFDQAELSFKERIVILDTIREIEFDEEGNRIIRDIYDDVRAVYPNNYIVKQHPKDKGDKGKEIRAFGNKLIPLEAYCFFNDFSERVLITNASFSAFTPKLLFDQEPTIVFTYGIMKEHYLDKDSDIIEAISELKAMYKNHEKIFVPESIDELMKTLDTIIQ